MSVKRQDLVKYLEANGFSLLRQGNKHAIYSNGARTEWHFRRGGFAT